MKTNQTWGRAAAAALAVLAWTAPQAAVAADAADGRFTVAIWNIGHFSLGVDALSRLPAAEAEKWETAYRAFLGGVGARILLVEEYSPHLDTEKTILARDSAFKGYARAFEGPSGGGGHVNSLFLNGCVCADSDVYAYSHRYQNTNYHFTFARIDGRETLVVATHLEPNWPTNHVAMRAQQIAQVLEAVGDFPRVIIGGDWNIDDIGELAPFAAAGFTLANDGSYKTCFSWDPKMAIDNLLVRGFAVSDVRVHADKRLSDHCLLSCVLTPRAGVRTPPAADAACYRPFLTADEAVVWKNRRLADITAVSATVQGRWIPIRHRATGVIVDRTPTTLTVQFQALDGHCKAVRAYFRQDGADIVARADKAGFCEAAFFGKRMPDAAFKHALATSADTGAYGVCRLLPSARYPLSALRTPAATREAASASR